METQRAGAGGRLGDEEILTNAVGGDAVFFDEARAHVTRMSISHLNRTLFVQDEALSAVPAQSRRCDLELIAGARNG